MSTECQILRSNLLEYVKGSLFNSNCQLSHGNIKSFFENQGIYLDKDANDWRMVQQILHELYIEGVIVFGVKINPHGGYDHELLQTPWYQLTEYGERVVNETGYQPHDPDGYLARLKSDIPQVDDIIVRYLEECLSCFRRNLLLASAVMLGCAAEKAVLLLIEKFGQSINDPTDKVNFQKETNIFIIKIKYAFVLLGSFMLAVVASVILSSAKEGFGNLMRKREAILVYFPIVVIIFMLINSGAKRQFIKAHRKALSEKCGHLFGNQEMEVRTDGILVRSKTGEELRAWQALGNVDETDSHIFIYLDKSPGYVISKHSIKEGDASKFIEFLRSRLAGL